MNYYISDTHFGHENLLKLSRSPFSSVEKMDEAMIKNWNDKVKNSDTVYIIGDLIYKSAKDPQWYLDRLNGKKILILGNHDDSWLRRVDASKYFIEVTRLKEATVEGRHVTFCHYPMLEWRDSRKIGSHKLGYLIYGHIHNRVSPLYRPLFEIGNALNAGADINGYAPVTFEELQRNNELFKLSVMSDPVDKAFYLCRSYHMHQSDKAGVSYAEHPIHVASKVDSPEQKIVAVLHDTLEDTDLRAETIEELFGTKVLEAIMTMTHRDGEDYFSYIERVKKNPLARAVKIEDLNHNMDLSRLKQITDTDIARREKYIKALRILESPYIGGN